jgi:hypothetical protein
MSSFNEFEQSKSVRIKSELVKLEHIKFEHVKSGPARAPAATGGEAGFDLLHFRTKVDITAPTSDALPLAWCPLLQIFVHDGDSTFNVPP